MSKEQRTQGNTMQLAEILSDLTSLRVCDPTAALALVSARPPKSSAEQSQEKEKEDDADLKRVKDLVELHYSVKEAHKRGGLGKRLAEAREAVWRVVGE
ncbi:hypothetical protein K469DRAFT_569291 [Zopfia rhizophila CBS 207.26]|uniref:Uncharacterized protein n=1 Tax=Zopfia rhizophila CBS 207.26 TaxID=1314779 RepID=A0A6A6EB45_9PEZI|nr:hypothetical protein K469DRAFT_569291 [Zopfia rhizophila CBS 207.26]